MMLDDHLYSVNTRRSCRLVLRCTNHGRGIGSLEGARPAVAGRAAGALALVQCLRSAPRPLPRMGPGRRRPCGPDHRGTGRLHRRHPRRRAHQPAGRPARPRAHDVGGAGGRAHERGAGALGGAPARRARPALSHRGLPGRHLPARDEDRGDLVPRGPRLACFGYFGHMWELYAMWAWLGAFLAASLEARGGGSYAGLNASAATFVCAGLAGGVGAWAGGALADRWGRTTLTMGAMALSGLCAILIGLTFGGPPPLTLLVAVAWGVTVIADSAQFSTAVTELAPAAYVGTALTTQTCLGFALTMASIWLIPPVVALVGWRWAFGMLAIGPALGVVAMGRLRALPEAAAMAGGRR